MILLIKFLKDIDVSDKRVILRVDFNVPIENGKITDTNKIDEELETIDYLVEKKAKVIILSHFGRVKTEEDKEKNSLKPVFEYIKSLDKYDILFSAVPMGEMLDTMCKNLKPGQMVLVENTRFLDLNGDLESSCDIQLSMYWASLADLYIDDAFGSMHRNHASITGIPKYLPSAAGLLVEKEVVNLRPLIENPDRPFVVVMGGAKLDDKINLIYSLIEIADHILIGGGIANTFLASAGYDVGSSLVSDASLKVASAIMKEFPDKLVLPKDVITSPSYSEKTYELKKIDEIVIDDVIGDIGSKAIENYKRIISTAKTIFINGTVGMYESLPFSNGTQEILRIISETEAKKIVGGGDAAAATAKFGYKDKMDFISTGGGATLTYIANRTLPGLEALEASNEEDIG
ncbi:MAG TPA: phosphoglycerate kinase [Firmicutes bacterium]|nr:phosphoglycerate kinase [Bacillota bacterium]